MASLNMKKVAKLMVTTSLSQREIAEELDINECTISRYKNTDEFKKIIKEVEQEFLNSLSAKALRTMDNLLNARSEFVKFSASKDILDRTGYKPTDKLDVQAEIQTMVVDNVEED